MASPCGTGLVCAATGGGTCEACGGSGQPCCSWGGGVTGAGGRTGFGGTCTGSLTCAVPDGGGQRTGQ
jgi:hypothetical protein